MQNCVFLFWVPILLHYWWLVKYLRLLFVVFLVVFAKRSFLTCVNFLICFEIYPHKCLFNIINLLWEDPHYKRIRLNFLHKTFFFVLSVFVSFLTCLKNLSPKRRFWVHYKSGCGKLLCISNFTKFFSTKVTALGRKSHDFDFSKTTLPNRRNHIHSKERVVESSPA